MGRLPCRKYSDFFRISPSLRVVSDTAEELGPN